mgnify:FL=1
MKTTKKHRGIEKLKSKYGFFFTLPWLVGVAFFFFYPLLQSVLYTFSDVSIKTGEIQIKFLGIENIKEILLRDADYTNNLGGAMGTFAYSFPLIMVLSLILAILLNQKFKGRIFYRAVYFLPVIIATGVVMELIFTTRSGDLSSMGTDASVRDNMISASAVIDWLGLPSTISTYLDRILSQIMNLVWNCGIQIVLWIAGMQAIPDQLYEVSKVEGATKWEEFWFITFPMLSRITVLVIVFTMVDLITSKTDRVMTQAYQYTQQQSYGTASAMLWVYFLTVGLLVGILIVLFNRFCARRWE